jgi:hypothetical protein
VTPAIQYERVVVGYGYREALAQAVSERAMTSIDPSASNRQAAEQFAQAIFAASNPQQTAADVIHALLDHPWMEDELRNELIHAATLNLDADSQ